MNAGNLMLRWAALALGFAALWIVILLFGKHVVPLLSGFDYAVSALVNPDAYLPGLDEFFRAVTDHTNLVIAVPLISLAVAIGLWRLIELPATRCAQWSVGVAVIWCVLVGLVGTQLEAEMNIVLTICGVGVGLLALGVLPPRLIPALPARAWALTLLVVESLTLLVLWLSRELFWNPELMGANLLFLFALVLVLGLLLRTFHRLDDAWARRYVRVFWLVLLSSLMVSLFATRQIKDDVARPRPLSEAHAPWNEQLRPIPTEVLRGNSSYPSGHTAGTFALIAPLFWWLRDRKARGGLLAWGALQGVSRVYTVAHFTVDCLAGAALGFGTGTLVFFLLGGPALRAPLPETERSNT